MKCKKLVFIMSSVFCIIVFAAIFTSPAFSQEPQMTAFVEIQLKPGVGGDFDRFIKDEVIPALKKGGQQEMTVWKTAVFGTEGNVVFSWPMANFAEIDTPHPIVKALGPYGAQAMFTKMDTFAKSMRIFAMRGLPDLQIEAPQGYVAKLGLQVKVTVMPGRTDEYEKGTKVVIDVLKKTNAKGYYAGKVVVGGNINQYYGLVLLDNFTDVDAFGAAFGKAASETKMPPTAGIVDHVEMTMWSRDAELSIQPAAQ